MKRILTSALLALSLISGMATFAMEPEGPTFTFDGTEKKLSLNQALHHIKGYTAQKDNNNRIRIQGFHSYTPQREVSSIEPSSHGSIIKLKPNLWIFLPGKQNPKKFHTGYIIFHGKVCLKPKTFFPCNWEEADIIKAACQEGVCERLSDNDTRYQKTISLDEHDNLKHIKIVATKNTIITLYPVLHSKLPVLNELDSQYIAMQQIAIQQRHLLFATNAAPQSSSPDKSKTTLHPLLTASEKAHVNDMETELNNLVIKDKTMEEIVDGRGNTALHYAIQSGDYHAIQIVAHSSLINKANKDNKVPLVLAIESKNSDIIELLCRKGADTNHATNNNTPLLQAIATRNLEAIDILLAHGADYESTVKDFKGRTALDAIEMTFKDAKSCIEKWKTKKQEEEKKRQQEEQERAEAQAEKERRIQQYEKQKQQQEEIQKQTEKQKAEQKMVERIIMREIENKEEFTFETVQLIQKLSKTGIKNLIMHVAKLPTPKYPMVIQLLSCSECPDNFVTTAPLECLKHVAEQMPQLLFNQLLHAIENSNEKAVAKILDNNLIHCTEKQKTQALCIAAQQPNTDITTRVIAYAPSCINKKHLELTPLHYACKAGHLDNVKALCEAGADIDTKDKDDYTADDYASQHTNKAISTLLAAYKKEKQDKIREEKRAAEYTAERKSLIQQGYTDLMLAAHFDEDDLFKRRPKSHCEDHPSALPVLTTPKINVNEVGPHGLTPLMIAAQQGSIKVCDAFLANQDITINQRDAQGNTALMHAIQHNQEKIVPRLLRSGASVLIPNNQGITATSHINKIKRNEIIEAGNTELCKLVTATGSIEDIAAALDKRFTSVEQLSDEQRKQLFDAAIACTNASLAQHLKDTHNINIDEQNQNGETALHIAAGKGETEQVRILLCCGANPNTTDKHGKTPLIATLDAIDPKPETALCILGHAKKLTTLDNTFGDDNNNALILASAMGSTQVVKKLLEMGANPTLANKKEWTPLIIAEENEQTEVKELLLTNPKVKKEQKQREKQAQEQRNKALIHNVTTNKIEEVKKLLNDYGYTTMRNASGYTPLHIALTKGYLDIAKLLLKYGADINERATDSDTSLYRAALDGKIDTAQFIIHNGANVDAAVVGGFTPLHVATQYGHTDIVQLLLEKGANINAITTALKATPLHIAAQYGHTKIVQLLLDRNANINALGTHDYTALHVAAQFRHTDIVQLLLEKDANIDAITTKRKTALYYAAKYGRTNTVQLLLKSGAKINATNNKEATPLHIAAKKGHEAVVRLLLDRGANKEAAMNDGATPLHIAAYFGHEAVVRLLLDRDANKDAAMNNGITPLGGAAERGHESIVTLLLDKGANPLLKTNEHALAEYHHMTALQVAQHSKTKAHNAALANKFDQIIKLLQEAEQKWQKTH